MPSCSRCVQRKETCVYVTSRHAPDENKGDQTGQSTMENDHENISVPGIDSTIHVPPQSSSTAGMDDWNSMRPILMARMDEVGGANNLPDLNFLIDGGNETHRDPFNQLSLPDFDWIFSNTAEQMPDLMVDTFAPDLLPSGSPPRPWMGRMEPNAHGGDVPREGDESSHRGSNTSTAQGSDALTEIWPISWLGESAQFTSLPELGQSEPQGPPKSTFYHIRPIDDPTRDAIMAAISVPSEQSPWNSASLANFMGNEKIDRCIDMYFAHFDRVSYHIRIALDQVPYIY
jgi:hypothetical protein